MNQTSNPLLEIWNLPPFPRIRPEHIEPAIGELIAEHRALAERLASGPGPFDWEHFAQPIETSGDHLARVWSPVSHLNAVTNSPEISAAHDACIVRLADLHTELGQNEALHKAWNSLKANSDALGLDAVQRRVIDNTLRDFRLSGVALEPAQRERFRAIQSRLAALESQFEHNLLHATEAWTREITDATLLDGLPESALALLRQNARERDAEGHLLTLDGPSWHAVMTYAVHRDLRRELYEAYVTRASDQGPHAGQYDNTAVMAEILALRHESARLLGYANYAELALENRMARAPEEVLGFLRDLARRARPHALHENDELRDFAQAHGQREPLESWDIAYWSERLREDRFGLSDERLKPYFPETRVIPGLFSLCGRLYGIVIRACETAAVWHPDVRYYEVVDPAGTVRGAFYLDLYARKNKRSGAWMDDCVTRRVTREGVQTPVAYLTCNLSPPVDGAPALFTHDEVVTLFHEFGHGLHHLLTRIDHPAVAGIHGVEWDAVELPSQIMENWCYEREALALFSGHYQTGEALPDALLDKLRETRSFQGALSLLRQIEFSLFDFLLHAEYDPARGPRVHEILTEVRDEVAVLRPPSFNRFPHGFSHVFAGGYAAGYYSYQWAELLSADAFARFEEEGVMNPRVGADFLREVLERGGSRDALVNFTAFRGREPSIEPLLKSIGIG